MFCFASFFLSSWMNIWLEAKGEPINYSSRRAPVPLWKALTFELSRRHLQIYMPSIVWGSQPCIKGCKRPCQFSKDNSTKTPFSSVVMGIMLFSGVLPKPVDNLATWCVIDCIDNRHHGNHQTICNTLWNATNAVIRLNKNFIEAVQWIHVHHRWPSTYWSCMKKKCMSIIWSYFYFLFDSDLSCCLRQGIISIKHTHAHFDQIQPTVRFCNLKWKCISCSQRCDPVYDL